MQLETHVNKLYKATEKQLDKSKKQKALKAKLTDFENEIKDILTNLEGKEHLLAVIQEQEQRLEQEFAKQVGTGILPSQTSEMARRIEQEEADGDEKVEQVLRDIEAYNRLQADVEREERDHNQNILDQVQKGQVGRDDQVDEMERFAKEQIELYRKEQEAAGETE